MVSEAVPEPQECGQRCHVPPISRTKAGVVVQDVGRGKFVDNLSVGFSDISAEQIQVKEVVFGSVPRVDDQRVRECPFARLQHANAAQALKMLELQVMPLAVCQEDPGAIIEVYVSTVPGCDRAESFLDTCEFIHDRDPF
jgi:hypothetical protein